MGDRLVLSRLGDTGADIDYIEEVSDMQIDHIQLAMPHGREEDARYFWRELMGMEEVMKPPFLAQKGGCWFELGTTAVHVGVENDFRPQKKAHPAFSVADLDGIAQTLSLAGFPIVWDDALPNRRRFYSADPFGNRLEFMAQISLSREP